MADFGCCEFVYTRFRAAWKTRIANSREKRIGNSTNSAYSGIQSRTANRE